MHKTLEEQKQQSCKILNYNVYLIPKNLQNQREQQVQGKVNQTLLIDDELAKLEDEYQ